MPLLPEGEVRARLALRGLRHAGSNAGLQGPIPSFLRPEMRPLEPTALRDFAHRKKSKLEFTD